MAYFCLELPIPSDHLPKCEKYDYPLEQVAEGIGQPLETFARRLPHKHTNGRLFCNIWTPGEPKSFKW